MIDVTGVLPGLVPNPELGAYDHARYFRAKFFPRVTLAAKWMGQVALESLRVPRPMPELVQRRGIVSRGFGEPFPRW